MASIETKVASTILSVIRARREKPNGLPSVERSASTAPATLRVATFSDFDGVMDLRRTAGWNADSVENWERLWRCNPALTDTHSDAPIGWVLEAQGKVVGYLGNIVLAYHYGDRKLTAVTGSGLVAEPPYRAMTLSLNAAFYRQQSVDLFLTTTAVEAVGKIARAFKASPLPQADYDSVLFWVLQPGPFAEVVMQKVAMKPALSGIGSGLASIAVRADRFLRRRRPSRGSTTFAVTEIGVNEIGDDFQSLWMDKLQERPRLLADRSPATLRWHFEFPGDSGSARVLCCYKNGKLLGYAVVRHESPNQATGLRRSIIADMLAKDDDPAVLTSLCVAAYESAKSAGSHIFEVLGFPPGIRALCSQWHPYVRKYPACPFFYKAADPALNGALSDGGSWYASPYDGDTTLWGFGT